MTPVAAACCAIAVHVHCRDVGDAVWHEVGRGRSVSDEVVVAVDRAAGRCSGTPWMSGEIGGRGTSWSEFCGRVPASRLRSCVSRTSTAAAVDLAVHPTLLFASVYVIV